MQNQHQDPFCNSYVHFSIGGVSLVSALESLLGRLGHLSQMYKEHWGCLLRCPLTVGPWIALRFQGYGSHAEVRRTVSAYGRRAWAPLPHEDAPYTGQEGGRWISGRIFHLKGMGFHAILLSVPGNSTPVHPHLCSLGQRVHILPMPGLIIASFGVGQRKTGIGGCSEQSGIFPSSPVQVPPGHPASSHQGTEIALGLVASTALSPHFFLRLERTS